MTPAPGRDELREQIAAALCHSGDRDACPRHRGMADAALPVVQAHLDRAQDEAAALRAAVLEWAMCNEIAAPPLDWAALGAILRPPGDAPVGSQVEDIPDEAASAAAEGSGAEVRTPAEWPERQPTSPDPRATVARVRALCDEAWRSGLCCRRDSSTGLIITLLAALDPPTDHNATSQGDSHAPH